MRQKNRDGILIEKQDGQDKLLGLLYGNPVGRFLLKPLTAPWLSRLAGAFLSTRASCVLIKPFIRANGIDMQQFEPVKYHSYNDFFSRRIRPEVRPVDKVPSHFISPCDSKLTALLIDDTLRFTLKHTEYTVSSLLKNDVLAKQYAGGYALVFRLTVDDYHRYCYADDGEKEDQIRISGALHTVNPIANDYFPIYKENSREYTVLHSQNFGDLIVMEVGALMVGKIVNHHEKAIVSRGEEKGYFQFGGSTIVLLVKAGAALLDEDILANSREGIETVVKYGQKIGIAC